MIVKVQWGCCPYILHPPTLQDQYQYRFAVSNVVLPEGGLLLPLSDKGGSRPANVIEARIYRLKGQYDLKPGYEAYTHQAYPVL